MGLYDIALGREIHHAAWFSESYGWDDFQSLLNTSEPLLASEGQCQEKRIRVSEEYGKIQHAFYGTDDLLQGLTSACSGFGDAIAKSKFLPAIKLPETLKQTEFDILSLASLVYFSANNERSIIESVQPEYQPETDDLYFEYIETSRQAALFDPIKYFFGLASKKANAMPICMRIYTEQDLLRLAIESLDFQLFVLPGLNEDISKSSRNKSESRELKSKREDANIRSKLVIDWLQNRQDVPPTIEEIQKKFSLTYSKVQRLLKRRYPNDKRNKQFQEDYQSGGLVLVMVGEVVYRKAKLPMDFEKLLTGKWDDAILNAAGLLPLSVEPDGNDLLNQYS